MPGPILPISSPSVPEAIRPVTAPAASEAFQQVFAAAVGQVEGASRTAAHAVERFLSGEREDLHTTALAVQRAELSFELFLQVRNKVAQAYQEIMRMPM